MPHPDERTERDRADEARYDGDEGRARELYDAVNAENDGRFEAGVAAADRGTR